MIEGFTALYIYRAVSQVLSPQSPSKHRNVIVTAGMEWSALVLALVAVLLGFIAPMPLELLEVMG